MQQGHSPSPPPGRPAPGSSRCPGPAGGWVARQSLIPVPRPTPMSDGHEGAHEVGAASDGGQPVAAPAQDGSGSQQDQEWFTADSAGDIEGGGAGGGGATGNGGTSPAWADGVGAYSNPQAALVSGLASAAFGSVGAQGRGLASKYGSIDNIRVYFDVETAEVRRRLVRATTSPALVLACGPASARPRPVDVSAPHVQLVGGLRGACACAGYLGVRWRPCGRTSAGAGGTATSRSTSTYMGRRCACSRWAASWCTRCSSLTR
jgi:hypothetical protein